MINKFWFNKKVDFFIGIFFFKEVLFKIGKFLVVSFVGKFKFLKII